ncbi:MAG: FeoB-associated Cys-rich membrane protein [Lachnospiraceae bacterium]|nr:FeoB-associated Cys-rich membrane protein [Lachnospiraceae bacterium]
MTDLILVLIIVLILAVAITFIVKEKKKGNKCIGCPYSCNCHKNGKECNES